MKCLKKLDYLNQESTIENTLYRKAFEISVFDIYAKTILKLKASGKDENLDISGNPPGIYLIIIDQKPPKTFKVVLK